MGTFVNRTAFVIYAMATVTLVTCTDDDHQQFYEDMLKLHNDARDIHGADPLLINPELSQEAMDYLNKAIERKVNVTENYWYYNYIVANGSEPVTAKEIFSSMYNWGTDYDYDTEDTYKEAGSFTNIVWKKTKEVGFAYVYKDNTNYFSVIYKPIGNEHGKYIENVEKPKDMKRYKIFLDLINN